MSQANQAQLKILLLIYLNKNTYYTAIILVCDIYAIILKIFLYISFTLNCIYSLRSFIILEWGWVSNSENVSYHQIVRTANYYGSKNCHFPFSQVPSSKRHGSYNKTAPLSLPCKIPILPLILSFIPPPPCQLSIWTTPYKFWEPWFF